MADGIIQFLPQRQHALILDLPIPVVTSLYNRRPGSQGFSTTPLILSYHPLLSYFLRHPLSLVNAMAPTTPTKVHFLDPTSNVITELEPLTPPISVPPSPHLRTVELPPITSGYCTPTSPEPPHSSLQQLAQQQTWIHRILYQAGDLRFDAGMTLQPRLVSFDGPSGRSSPLFEYEPANLAEAATTPPLPSMLLVCDNLPWKIRVTSSLPNLFVTIYDVLQAIHISLRTPVVAAEWQLCNDQEDQDAILQTFERRIRRLSSESARVEERARSVRRIDCLMGMTRLVRVTSSDDPGVFVMEWGRP